MGPGSLRFRGVARLSVCLQRACRPQVHLRIPSTRCRRAAPRPTCVARRLAVRSPTRAPAVRLPALRHADPPLAGRRAHSWLVPPCSPLPCLQTDRRRDGRDTSALPQFAPGPPFTVPYRRVRGGADFEEPAELMNVDPPSASDPFCAVFCRPAPAVPGQHCPVPCCCTTDAVPSIQTARTRGSRQRVGDALAWQPERGKRERSCSEEREGSCWGALMGRCAAAAPRAASSPCPLAVAAAAWHCQSAA